MKKIISLIKSWGIKRKQAKEFKQSRVVLIKGTDEIQHDININIFKTILKILLFALSIEILKILFENQLGYSITLTKTNGETVELLLLSILILFEYLIISIKIIRIFIEFIKYSKYIGTNYSSLTVYVDENNFVKQVYSSTSNENNKIETETPKGFITETQIKESEHETNHKI